jgi:restriction system protein
MPMRPAGGGGRAPQPPRRAAQPRTQRATPRRAPGAEQRKTAEQLRQGADQQRRAADQQRRSAVRSAQQLRARQHQQFLREAHGVRRKEEAAQLTAEVRGRVAELESILSAGVQRSSVIDLDALHRSPGLPPFDPGPLATPIRQPTLTEFMPWRIAGLWGGQAGKDRREAAAREAYDRAWEKWESDEEERKEQLAAHERDHEALLAANREEAERYNARIAQVAAGLRMRTPEVVESFLRTVLRRVPLPAGFPRRAEVTYHPEEEERVTLRMVLPGREILPAISGYEYAESADEIEEIPLPEAEAADLYRDVIAQVVLLVVRDVLEAEPRLGHVTCHGLVDGSPAGDQDSGQTAPPCLISLTVDRDTFATLELDQVSPEHCLRQLDAQVSPDPYTYQPVTAPA